MHGWLLLTGNKSTIAALGVPTLDGLGAVGGAYADHEYLEVGFVEERANLVAGLVKAIRGRS